MVDQFVEYLVTAAMIGFAVLFFITLFNYIGQLNV